MKFSGNIVDVVNNTIYKGSIEIENGIVVSLTADKSICSDDYIMPGFVDSHIHIESSMLIPSEFARLATIHGTVATVSDPHEIANVLGIAGIEFMISNGKKVPFKFHFGAPSCVPATAFESAGAVVDTKDIEALMGSNDIYFLGEMMNYPGVLFDDNDVHNKLKSAKKFNKPIDGHAPGLIGSDALKYANSGISTDHECFSIEEAEEKVKLGMKILIREGSAAKNFDELAFLLLKYPGKIMLCSDDKHPDDLINGHLNLLCKRALEKGIPLLNIIQALTIVPVNHYKLNVGLLQKNDDADFIIVDNLTDFNIKKTFVKGKLVAENGNPLIESINEIVINNFNAKKPNPTDIRVKYKNQNIRVIDVIEGQLITKQFVTKPTVSNHCIVSNPSDDILKLVVVNRYNPEAPSIGFIRGFKITKGAIASSVSHDSHNIIAVGSNDDDICNAINSIIDAKGGISVSTNSEISMLQLPFAGLMSGDDGYIVAKNYELLDKKAKILGSNLQSPFMTLSFMALLVIPELKLSDKGLFDGTKFEFTTLEA